MPAVTIIMPVRNEADHIKQSLGAVLAQDYPSDRLQILVVDGRSADGTRDIVRQMSQTRQDIPAAGGHRAPACAQVSGVRLLDNPFATQATALNIGLQYASGEIIARVDGHCEVAPDYVRRCVEVLKATDADCVGGPLVTVGDDHPTGQAIALAQSAVFGVGRAAFRTGRRTPGCVDTVAFGAYRRRVFEVLGRFDESLVPNEDDEFNLRLVQAGGKIWLDPDLHCTYYCRTTLRGLWRQYFAYGLNKPRVIRKRGAIASGRHLVPPAFVMSLVASVLAAAWTHQPLWAVSVAGPYALVNALASLHSARGHWRVLSLLPVAFLTLHLAYGIGFLCGVACLPGRASRSRRPGAEPSADVGPSPWEAGHRRDL